MFHELMYSLGYVRDFLDSLELFKALFPKPYSPVFPLNLLGQSIIVCFHKCPLDSGFSTGTS